MWRNKAEQKVKLDVVKSMENIDIEPLLYEVRYC